MQNINMYLPLEDGGRLDVKCENGQDFIQSLFGNNISGKPESLRIEATTAEGLPIRITIPYSEEETAIVEVVQ